MPFRPFCHTHGISPAGGYNLLAAGELESFHIGTRRFVLLDSWDSLVERRVAAEREKISRPRPVEHPVKRPRGRPRKITRLSDAPSVGD